MLNFKKNRMKKHTFCRFSILLSIILVFLYSLVAMSSRSERFIEQLMEEEGRKDTDEQDMEAIITEGKERQEHE